MTRLRALNESSSEDSEDDNEEKETIEAQEERAFSQYKVALACRQQGNFGEAERLFADLLQCSFLVDVEPKKKTVEPKDGLERPANALKYACYKNLGIVLVHLNRHEEGLQCLLQASELDGSDVTLWQQIGNVALQVDDLYLASHAFQEGLQCNPKHWPCLDSLVQVLFAIDDYMGCLLLLSRALELDPDYTRGLALRNQIAKEQPSLLENFKYFYPNENSPFEVTSKLDSKVAEQLVNQARDFRERCNKKVSFDWSFQCQDHSATVILAQARSQTWLELGNALLSTYSRVSLSGNYLSPLKITFVEQAKRGKENEQTLNDTSVTDTEPIPATTNEIETELIEADSEREDAKMEEQTEEDATEASGQEQELEEEAGTQEQGIVSSQSRSASVKRKRKQPSLALMDQWSKRRSGRRSGRRSDIDRDESNLATTLRSILPSSLLPKDLELEIAKANKRRLQRDPVDLLAEDSMDTMDFYRLLQSKESQSQNHVFSKEDAERNIKKEGYFGTELEKDEVRKFVAEHCMGDRHIIFLLHEYLKVLTSKTFLTWPCDISPLFLAGYEFMRRHVSHTPPLDDNFSNNEKLSDALLSLLYCELFLDIWHQKNSKEGLDLAMEDNFPLVIAVGHLMLISPQGYLFSSTQEHCKFMLRLHWLKAHFFLSHQNCGFAINALQDVTVGLDIVEAEDVKSVEAENPFTQNARLIEGKPSHNDDKVELDKNSASENSSVKDCASKEEKVQEKMDKDQSTQRQENVWLNEIPHPEVLKEEKEMKLFILDDDEVENTPLDTSKSSLLMEDEKPDVASACEKPAMNTADPNSTENTSKCSESGQNSDATSVCEADLTKKRAPESNDKIKKPTEDPNSDNNSPLEVEQTKKSVSDVKNQQEKLSDNSSSTSTLFNITLSNLRRNRNINKTTVRKMLLSLTRQQQLSEVDELYSTKQYDALVGTLTECFKFCAQQADTPKNLQNEDVENLPDRPTQMAMLLDSLWQLQRYSDCFYWSEACLLEAFNRYLNCAEGEAAVKDSEEQQMWVTTIERLLAGLDSCLRVAGHKPLEKMPKTCLTRLVQTLSSMLCHQLEQSECSMEMAIECTTPWVVLHRIVSFVEQSEPLKPDSVPASMLVLFEAHEYMAKQNRCCRNDGILLNLLLDVVVPRLRTPELASERDFLKEHIEQAIYCMYGHPKKSSSGRRRLQDHKVPHQLNLTWERCLLLLDFYQPDELHNFDSRGSINADEEQLFLRIRNIVPDVFNPIQYLSPVEEFIEGKTDEFPESTNQFPYSAANLFYLLADYYLKSYKWESAIEFYMLDICVNPYRFDSWAGMALARSTVLTTKLNSCYTLKSDKLLMEKERANRCFQQAVEIDPEHSTLWVEYGNFAYVMHSFCSRMLKTETDSLSMEQFNELETEKDSMLSLAEKCFTTAEQLGQDERWLQQYMLGKVAEKRGENPAVFLKHYKAASQLLFESNASYPLTLVWDPQQALAFEAHEVYYRIFASILKSLESMEGKSLDAELRLLFEDTITEVNKGPFMSAVKGRVQIAASTQAGAISSDTKKRKSVDQISDQPFKKLSTCSTTTSTENKETVDSTMKETSTQGLKPLVTNINENITGSLDEKIVSKDNSEEKEVAKNVADKVNELKDSKLETGEVLLANAVQDVSSEIVDNMVCEGSRICVSSNDNDVCELADDLRLSDSSKQAEDVTSRLTQLESGDRSLNLDKEEKTKRKTLSCEAVKRSLPTSTFGMLNRTNIVHYSNQKVSVDNVSNLECADVELDRALCMLGVNSLVKEHDYAAFYSKKTSINSDEIGAGTDSTVNLDSSSSLEIVNRSPLSCTCGTPDSELSNEFRNVQTKLTSNGSIQESSCAKKGTVENVLIDNMLDVGGVEEYGNCSSFGDGSVQRQDVLKTRAEPSGSVTSVVGTESEDVKEKDSKSDAKKLDNVGVPESKLKGSNSSSPSQSSSSSSSSSTSDSTSDSSSSSDDSSSEAEENEGNKTVIPSKENNKETKTEGDSQNKPRAATNTVDLNYIPLIRACLSAMEECLARYPRHYKSLYRLCHYYFRSKHNRNLSKCRQLLLGEYRISHTNKSINGLFKCNNINSMFNDMWRIPVEEIDRAGSFAFHMSRCVILLMELLRDQQDYSLLLKLSVFLKKEPERDKKYLRDNERIDLSKQAFIMCLASLRGNAKQTRTIDSLLDLYNTIKDGLKEFQSKENVFKTILSDAYKKLKNIVSDFVMYDLAVDFCQNEINSRKAAAAAKAQAKAIAQAQAQVQASMQPRFPTSISSPPVRGPITSSVGNSMYMPTLPAQRGRGRPPKSPRFNNYHMMNLAAQNIAAQYLAGVNSLNQGSVESILQLAKHQHLMQQQLQLMGSPSTSSQKSLNTSSTSSQKSFAMDLAKDRPAISITPLQAKSQPQVSVASSGSIASSKTITTMAPSSALTIEPVSKNIQKLTPESSWQKSSTPWTGSPKTLPSRPLGARNNSRMSTPFNVPGKSKGFRNPALSLYQQPAARPAYVPRPPVNKSMDSSIAMLSRRPGIQLEAKPQSSIEKPKVVMPSAMSSSNSKVVMPSAMSSSKSKVVMPSSVLNSRLSTENAMQMARNRLLAMHNPQVAISKVSSVPQNLSTNVASSDCKPKVGDPNFEVITLE